jgi:anti-anti-sigma regulatory factor
LSPWPRVALWQASGREANESESSMAISVDSQDGTQYIRLIDAIDIGHAAELRQILMDAIASSPRIRIPICGATAIDVTAVQLLWASVDHASLAGKDLAVEGPLSEEVEKSFAGTGIFPILNSVAAQPGREAASVLTSRL